MLIKTFTDNPVAATADALRTAVEANQYGVMQVHNLRETLQREGVEFQRACSISIQDAGAVHGRARDDTGCCGLRVSHEAGAIGPGP